MESFAKTEKLETLRDNCAQVTEGYSAPEIPLSSYAILMGAYATVFGGLFLLTKKRRESSPAPHGATWR